MEFVVGKALDLCDVDHNESSKSNKDSHDEESSVANSDKLKNISDFYSQKYFTLITYRGKKEDDVVGEVQTKVCLIVIWTKGVQYFCS